MTPSERRMRRLLRRALPELNQARFVYENDMQTFSKEHEQINRLLADIYRELASTPPTPGAKE